MWRSSYLETFSKPFLKLNSLTGTFKDFCFLLKNTYLAECLLKTATAFIWPASIDQEFDIPPKSVLKIDQCVDFLKRIMGANQCGIHQDTFRVSSVLHLYIGRSRGPATFVQKHFKTTATFFCVIVTKSSILDDRKFLNPLLLCSCLNFLEP